MSAIRSGVIAPPAVGPSVAQPACEAGAAPEDIPRGRHQSDGAEGEPKDAHGSSARDSQTSARLPHADGLALILTEIGSSSTVSSWLAMRSRISRASSSVWITSGSPAWTSRGSAAHAQLTMAAARKMLLRCASLRCSSSSRGSVGTGTIDFCHEMMRGDRGLRDAGNYRSWPDDLNPSSSCVTAGFTG